MNRNRGRRVSAALSIAFSLTAGLVIGAPLPAAAACGDEAGPGVDWAGCDFPFSELSDVNLTGADLSNIDLSYSVLFGANLSDTNLRGANLKDSFPVGAILNRADLRESNLVDADFVGAKLINADLRGANLEGADFDLSEIGGANFVGANLEGTDFEGVTGAATAIFVAAPAGAADAAVTPTNTSIALELLANDRVVDGGRAVSLSVSVVAGPKHGSFDPASGRYTPARGFTGVDTFTYRPVASVRLLNAPVGAVNTAPGPVTSVTVRVVQKVVLKAPYAGASGDRGQIARLYVATLNRAPDKGGFDYWLGRLRAGQSLESIADGFLGSSEFLGDTSSLSNTAFITLLYQNVFIRNPDASGLRYWVSQLDGGLSRANVLVFFSNGPEFKALTGTS